MRLCSTHAFFTGLAGLLIVGSAAAADYTYSRNGNSRDVNRSSRGGLLLAGGGSDNDDAMRWFKDGANGGDVVVLRTSGNGGYNRYLRRELGGIRPDSVETIVFHNRNASFNSFVLGKIEDAEAIFITGGDQAEYLDFWADTPVETILRDKIAAGDITLGGTSAGMAVLGEAVFSAENGTVYSDEALDDPYSPYMTFEYGFVRPDFMGKTITDTHFTDRGRDGRMMAFLARSQSRYGTRRVYGIGADEAAALTIDTAGIGTVHSRYNDAYVKFFYPTRWYTTLTAGQPLRLDDVEVWRLRDGDRFDLANWTPDAGGTPFTYDAANGTLSVSTGAP